ncbi:MAG TPA: CHRD domain-containing protein [Methylomirabilota bacterium]|nr:CHRD domain-containing protein [Methylomirabilota bacterium]
MRRNKLLEAVVVVALLVFSASYAYADEEFFARLNGFQEVGGLGAGQTGAIRTNGTGTLHLKVDKNAKTATFTLTYSDLGTTPPGTGTVTQAHIHFGRRHVGGGIMVFFCSNLANPPAGTPACPVNSGTVSGTFTAASVIGPTAQNIGAGDFEAFVDALRANAAYANVHTTSFPAGEIRGQIHKDNRRDDKDHDGNHNGR